MMKATTSNNQKHCFTKSLWMFVVLCTLLGSTTYGQAKTNPQEGIEFSKVLGKHYSGMVKYGILAKETTITNHGIPYTFAADKLIYFYESGKVKEGNLVHDKILTIEITPIPLLLVVGWVLVMLLLSMSGKVKKGVLAQDTTVTISGKKYTFAADRYIDFYESGKVKKGFSAQDTTVTTHDISYTFKYFISFYESGKVQSGFLAQDTTVTIHDISYTFSSVISFYESGKVEGGWLAKETTIIVGDISYPFAAGKRTFFYESGKMKGGTLAKETTIIVGDISYTFSSWRDITFYESGKIKGGGLSNSLTMSIGERGINLMEFILIQRERSSKYDYLLP